MQSGPPLFFSDLGLRLALPTDLGHSAFRIPHCRCRGSVGGGGHKTRGPGSSTVLCSATSATATIPPLTRLRKRAIKGDEAGKQAESPEKDPGTASLTESSTSNNQQMAYGRRTINFYQRGAVGGDSVPLSSYKNKILVFLAATAVYTAFLWKSGGSLPFR